MAFIYNLFGYYGQDPNTKEETTRAIEILKLCKTNTRLYERLHLVFEFHLKILKDCWKPAPMLNITKRAFMIGCRSKNLDFVKELISFYPIAPAGLTANNNYLLREVVTADHSEVTNWVFEEYIISSSVITASDYYLLKWLVYYYELEILEWLLEAYDFKKSDFVDSGIILRLIRFNELEKLKALHAKFKLIKNDVVAPQTSFWSSLFMGFTDFKYLDNKPTRPNLVTQGWLNENFGVEIDIM